jgi:tetratricopeptide (TPR) repeat protein
MSHSESAARIDRLLDAIDLVQDNRYEEARTLLRELIREDNDFEDAWLWLSVTVDSLDQSSLCLDNVLRVNPDNALAAGALYRLRESEIRMEKHRERLRLIRDVSLGLFWLLVIVLLYAVLFSYIGQA